MFRNSSMGWKSAVGLTHEAHRSILTLGNSRSKELPAISDESEHLYTEADCVPMSSLHEDEGSDRYEHHPEEQAADSASCNSQVFPDCDLNDAEDSDLDEHNPEYISHQQPL